MPAAIFRKRLADAGLDARLFFADAGDAVTARHIRLPPPIGHLYTYLLESGWVVPVQTAGRL